jgi:S-adenosylmethionine:tRNA ribosyltransferase-isomerase
VNISDFDFELPPELIAQEPSPERDASRLLVLDRETGVIRHERFGDLPSWLAPGDLLVVNRSRVFPARVVGHRRNGGAAEVLLVQKLADGSWEALLRPGRRLRTDDVIECAEGLRITVLSSAPDAQGRRRVRIECPPEKEEALLSRVGRPPLPPYIKRPPSPSDLERYQTVYARDPGSVAAPTAGLHFTDALLQRLRSAGTEIAEIVLHVGPGTFQPVQVQDVRDHRVAAEHFEVPVETAHAIAAARERGARVVAVGTTTARTLETATSEDGQVRAGTGSTELVVVPGYRIRAFDALVTNFHLPRSSLLLLVCAFAGRERVLSAYREAASMGYRFYSYGDAMLITSARPR